MSGTRKVLVVDDDVSMLAIVLRWLADAGHEVMTCQTVESAAQCLQFWRPDVLVTDVRLNGANGLYLAVLANQHLPGVTSIVMSGFVDPVLADEARRENALFLVKPFSRDELLTALTVRARPASASDTTRAPRE